MRSMASFYFSVFLIFSKFFVYASPVKISYPAIHLLQNKNSRPSLVNSVDFHPNKNLFCATFTHNDQIVIYHLNKSEQVKITQVLKIPHSKLSCPQHALFSEDGRSLIVANWCNQTFTVYLADLNGLYQKNTRCSYSIWPA